MRYAAIIFATALVASVASAASILPDMKGTVDAWTPAMLDKARHAAMGAGYHPTAAEFVQDGNVFLTAAHDNKVYGLVFTKSGKLFASNGIPETSTASTG